MLHSEISEQSDKRIMMRTRMHPRQLGQKNNKKCTRILDTKETIKAALECNYNLFEHRIPAAVIMSYQFILK